jgi:hypothetical protein
MARFDRSIAFSSVFQALEFPEVYSVPTNIVPGP